MKKTIICILLFISITEAQKIKYGNFSPQLKADLKDTTGSQISDSLNQSNIIDSDQYVDSSIDWDHLSDLVKSRVEVESLYDYQDPSVNTALQMMVRRAHYIFDRYYNENNAYMQYEYDANGTTYFQDRRSLVNYMGLLKALHKTTNRNKYLYKLQNIYDDVIVSGIDTIDHNITGGRNCYSVVLNPLIVDDAPFSHHDVRFHMISYYLWEQLADSTYYNNTINFADVLYSYITKSGVGWGWGYNWTGVQPSPATCRVNTIVPQIKFYQFLESKDVTTTDLLTIATYDSIMDSCLFLINTAWDTINGDTSSGGWKVYSTDADDNISSDYTRVMLNDLMSAANEQGSVDSISGLSSQIQKVVNYYTRWEADLLFDLSSDGAINIASLIKQAKSLGYTTVKSDSIADAFIITTTTGSHFSGIVGGDGTMSGGILYSNSNFWIGLEQLIEFCNSESFSEDYGIYYWKIDAGSSPYTWVNHQPSFRFMDGFKMHHWRHVGAYAIAAKNLVGYWTLDDRPACPAPSEWGISGSEKIKYTLPIQFSGNFYEVTHWMGSDFAKIKPSSADTVDIVTKNREEVADDSSTIFYYNAGGDIQHILAASISFGDSIIVQGDLGIALIHIQQTTTVEQPAVGMIFDDSDEGTTTFKLTDSSATAWYFRSQSEIDSIYVFYTYPENNGSWWTGSGWDFTYTNLAVENLMITARQILTNGIDYEGLLENKLQTRNTTATENFNYTVNDASMLRWYDVYDTDYLTLHVDSITHIRSQANTDTLIQITATKKPIYDATDQKIVFVDNDDYLVGSAIPSLDVTGTDSTWTVEGFVRTTQSSGSHYLCYVINTSGWYIRMTNNNFQIILTDGVDTYTKTFYEGTASEKFNDGIWHYFAATVGADSVTCYIDGVPANGSSSGTFADIDSIDSGGVLSFGGLNGGGWIGDVRWFAISDTTYTDTQIYQRFKTIWRRYYD